MSRDVCWHLLLSPQTFSQVAGMYGQIEDDFYFEMHDHLSALHCFNVLSDFSWHVSVQ